MTASLETAKRHFMLGLVEDVEERRREFGEGTHFPIRLREVPDAERGRTRLHAFTSATATADSSFGSAHHVSSIAHADPHTLSMAITNVPAAVDAYVPTGQVMALRSVGRAEVVVNGPSGLQRAQEAEMRAQVSIMRKEVHALTQSLISACGTELFADLLAGSYWDPLVVADEGAGAEDQQATLAANADYFLRQYRIEMDAQDAKRETEEREQRLASNLKRLSSLSALHQGAVERAKEMQQRRAEGKENRGEDSRVGDEGSPPTDGKRNPSASHKATLQQLQDRARQAGHIFTAPPPSPPVIPKSIEEPRGASAAIAQCVSAIDMIRAQVMLAHIMQAAELNNPPQHVSEDKSVGGSIPSNLTPLDGSSFVGVHPALTNQQMRPQSNKGAPLDETTNSGLDFGRRDATKHSEDTVHSPASPSILKRNASSSNESHHQKSTTSSSPRSSNKSSKRVVMVGEESVVSQKSDSVAMANSSSAIAVNRSGLFKESSVMLDASVRSRGSRLTSPAGNSPLDSSAGSRGRVVQSPGEGAGASTTSSGSSSDGSDLDPSNKSNSSSRPPVVRRTGGWGLAEPVSDHAAPPTDRGDSRRSASAGEEDAVMEMSNASSSIPRRRQSARQAPSRPDGTIPSSRPTKKAWSLFGCFGNKKGQVAD